MMNEEMEPTTNTSETTEPVSAEHESVEASQPEDLALQIGRAILNDPHTVLPHFASQQATSSCRHSLSSRCSLVRLSSPLR